MRIFSHLLLLSVLVTCSNGKKLSSAPITPGRHSDYLANKVGEEAHKPPISGTGTTTLPDIPARKAAEGMGTGFNLGQMFDNDQHPRTFDAAAQKIDAYYDLGYRHVRIPVTWTEEIAGQDLVLNPDTGEMDGSSERLKVIVRVIDHALSRPDFFVVINAHHEKALKTKNKWWVLKRLWRDIATLFKDRSHRLIFEILNEPHLEDGNNSPMPAADLRYMTQQAYKEIRNIDTKRIIAIGGNQWFSANEIPQVWTNLDGVGGGDDLYLMATFHHYDPWSFCGDNQGDYADPWTESNIEEPMKTMKHWAETVGKGMPVYIGEWGVGWGSRFEKMECNNIRLWYETFDFHYARNLGMPTTVWDDGGWFMIYDHATGEFNNNLHRCIIEGECDWLGTERFNIDCK